MLDTYIIPIDLFFTSVYFNNILSIVTNHFIIIMTSVMRENIMSTNLDYHYIKNMSIHKFA